MVNQSVLVVVAILLATSCTLTSGNKKDIISPGHVIPFQPISADEYRTILDLSDGNPVISEARLISSGLSAIHQIANSIKNGAVTALNLTGIESAASALIRPSGDRVQGYPLCVIRTNKRSARGARQLNSIFQSNDDDNDSGDSYGSYTINLSRPGHDDNEDDYDDDEHYPHYSTARPSRRPRPTRPNRPNWPGTDDNDDSNTNDNSNPVVNCVVVLKRPSSSSSTVTRRPTRRPTRPTRPAHYPTQNPSHYPPQYPPQYPPHYPGYYPPSYPNHPYPSSTVKPTTAPTTPTPKPHNPHNPQYPYYPYPIIPIPVPAYHGSYPSYPGYPGYPSYGHGWNNWHYRPRPHYTPTTKAPGTVPSSTIHPAHNWPVYPGPGGNLHGRLRNPVDSEAVRHHYLGNGAKDVAYDGASLEAAEDDEIESEVSDIIEAIAKAKSARVFKSNLKVLPLAEESEESK